MSSTRFQIQCHFDNFLWKQEMNISQTQFLFIYQSIYSAAVRVLAIPSAECNKKLQVDIQCKNQFN